MSTRTIFEINHDTAFMIERNPDSFVRDLGAYLSSASGENAKRLERYGFRRAWWGHHSDERRVVSQHDDVKL
jgi:hypothetical protein